MIKSIIKKLPGIRQLIARFQRIHNEISKLQNKISELENEGRKQEQEAKKKEQDTQLEIDLLKKEMTDLKNSLESYKEEYLCSVKELKSEIDRLKKEDVSLRNNLETFKKRYGRERYQMKMDMRTNLYKALPKEKYEEELKNWYLLSTGKMLDLDNPKTYNEKIQWLKLHDHDERKTKLSDKYLVREWVKETIGEKYLVPLLGGMEMLR